MERLGLWGEGTPSFAAFQDFLDAVGGRGVGALELVAMDMKARGMFVCRTLSFQGTRPLLVHATAPCGLSHITDSCALELFAIDMKAPGMAVCRTLSFQGDPAACCGQFAAVIT